ncbi:MAG: DUF1592 domain-containing protein [Verrucomicrobiota bacterium]
MHLLDENVYNFLQNYCISCHGADEEKGDRVFHQFAVEQDGKRVFDSTNRENLYLLEDILDQLNLGKMPPSKDDVAQPSNTETAGVVQWITNTLTQLEADSSPQQTVMRRLNRREYRNTMRNLLGLGELAEDPTRDFPEDEVEEGFRNLGEYQNLTDAHLDAYLTAASEYLKIAFPAFPKTESSKRTFLYSDWGIPDEEATTPFMYRIYNREHDSVDIGAGYKDLTAFSYLATFPRSLLGRNAISQGGYYRISFKAEAIGRLTHPYDAKMIPADLTAPLQIGLYIAFNREGIGSGGSNQRRRIALWDLKDLQSEDYSKVVWLNPGAIPFLNWDNGPGSSNNWMRDICEKYHTDIEFTGGLGSNAWHVIGKDAIPGRKVSDVWQGPMLRVRDFAIEGPLAEQTHLPEAPKLFDRPDHRQALRSFMTAAFRRPVTQDEIEGYFEMMTNAREELGMTDRQALLSTFKAVLVSPDFLYLRESREKVTSFQLANRISYFLWSSMPDEELRELAATGELFMPSVRQEQAARMLRDEKALQFAEAFAESWLRLDKLGSMPPDSSKFWEYYALGLGESMRGETHQFLARMIRENRPVSEFLTADWTYLNQSLAKHYQIDDVIGSSLQLTKLPADSPRRGLLGHGSILTLTANGVDTSPVNRGVWVLENILGKPPSQPPPDVEPLDTDTRGARTIREQLAKHRSHAACAGCHEKIDPYGFPLEYFNAIGGYRETYFRGRWWNRQTSELTEIPGASINGNGQLQSGQSFSNPRDLSQYLVTEPKLFLSALTRKLATYALARKLNYRDEPEIKRIVGKISGNPESGFRDLIIEVVTSKLMVTR